MRYGRCWRSCCMNDPREPDEHVFAERFGQAYERTSRPGPEARARIVDAARARPRPRRSGFHPDDWFEPRSVTLRPIAALAAAIVLVTIGALLAHHFDARARRDSMIEASAAGPPG